MTVLMRIFSVVLIAIVMVACCTRCVWAEPTRSIVLTADVCDYYSNRFVLTGDGNVRARLSDGTTVSGDTFSMDLKLNRFLIAGNVHLDGPTVHEVGAAFAGYPDLDRSYFLTASDVPDRWTYFGLNFTDKHAGRQQPGDAFLFPNLGGAPPYLVGNHVTIFPKNNIEFGLGSRIRIAGVYTPTPGWVVNYSSNPNFYQNAFAGAVFDIAIPYHGAADAISAFHIRYDQVRGAYISFDQHFVHNADYLVLSVNPLTQDARQWNMIAYKRESNAFETRLFSQVSTLSNAPLAEPSQSSAYNNFQANSRFGKYAVSLNIDQFNNSLLPTDNSGFTPQGLRVDGHPFDAQLSLQSFEDEIRVFRRIGVPVKFQYRAGYGWDHDGYGILSVNGEPTWGGPLYPTIFQKYIGLTVYTPSIKLVKQLSASIKVDKQRQWFSLPHHIDTTNFTATIANTPQTTKLPAVFVSYNVLNLGDYYGAQQLVAYPPAANVYVSPYGYGTFTGLAAFRGLATQRTLTASAVYTPTQYFALNVTAQHFDVTPGPVPGLGGQPPYQITADVRFRVTSNLLVDVARSYYFNFGNDRWSPQFQVTLSP